MDKIHGNAHPVDSGRVCKNAFFTAARIERKHYPYRSLVEVVADLRKTADISLKDISKGLGSPNHSAGGALIKDAAMYRARAQRLGEIMAPLLDAAEKKGRIIRESGLINPNWVDPADPKVFKKTFLQICGIKPSNRSDVLEPYVLLDSYYKIVFQNTGLDSAQIGAAFKPKKVESWYIKQRLEGNVKMDLEFVKKFAAAIKPALDRGVKEEWLDEESKLPLSFEMILAKRLRRRPQPLSDKSAAYQQGKRAVEFHVDLCKKNSGLPVVAIGPMLGHEFYWFSQRTEEGARSYFSAADVAHIADAIFPYLEGKKWSGVLDVTNERLLGEHRKLCQFVVEKIKQGVAKRLPSQEKEIDKTLEGVPHTLGPTLTALRLAAGVQLTSFAAPLTPTALGLFEANLFADCSLQNDGNKSTLCKRLEHFADSIAAHWPEHAKEVPGTEVEEASVRRVTRGKRQGEGLV